MSSEPPPYASYTQAPAARPPSPPTPTWPTTQHWTGHRYQSVQNDLPPPPSPPSPSSPPAARYPTAPVDTQPIFSSTAPATLPWRPFYLRRTVLACCAVAFALILVAVEALLAFSNKHQGIGNGNSGQHYLWTFGPTAILTLVAAFWSRVEYQSKMVAPWLRMERGPSQPQQGLLLDYVSDFQPWSIVKGFRNRDYVVSIATAISVLIKIMIIVSTGLISLSITPVVDEAFPMVVQDRFADDPVRLANAGPMAWYFMRGLIDGNLTYPEGIWSDYAFQSVRRADFPTAALSRVVVDGLKNDLECLPAELVLTGAHYPDPRNGSWTTNVTVTAPGCKMNNLRLKSPRMSAPLEKQTVQFARLVVAQCDGADSDDGKRIFVMLGNMTYEKDTSHSFPAYHGQSKVFDYFATMHQSSQFVCIPSYHISPVEVVSNGTKTISVTPVPGAPKRTLDSVTAWALVKAQWNAFISSDALSNQVDNAFSEPSISISDGTKEVSVETDIYSLTALQSHLPPNATLRDLFAGTLLRDVATGYHQQILSALTKMSVTESASIDTTGAVTVNAERLIIRGWATHWMAGLTGACVLLALAAIFLVPTRGILPCSPSGIPGLASILQNSPDLTERLRYYGAASEKELLSLLQGTSYQAGVGRDSASGRAGFSITDTRSDHHAQAPSPPPRASRSHPAIIHPASRASLLVVLAGLIVALELMLRKSGREQGLGDVGDDTFLHYTWTALPALVLGSLALTMSAMDFRVRCLAPYATLMRPTSTKTFMALDFLDMSVPRTMYRAATLRNLGVLATTLAFLTSSLFTIFSSSLFQALTVPAAGQITLRANMSFNLEADGQSFFDKTPLVMASIILEGNMTYPSHTYEDLAFPQFVSTSLALPNTSFDTSSARVNVIVPAVRSRLQCRFYSRSEITTNHTRNATIVGDRNPLNLRIQGESCEKRSNSSLLDYQSDIFTETQPNTTYFGVSRVKSISGSIICSDLLYAWGELDHAAAESVLHVAAMGCNSTLERVDVNTTFLGTSLEIDPTHPPQPLENTAGATTLPANASLGYFGIAGPPVSRGGIDEFFSILTTSRWAIPVESLGDAAARDTISDAIKFQHNIIQAQLLRLHMGPANATNATRIAPGPGEDDSQPLYRGEIQDAVARRRVVMDELSTRVLQGLLGAAFLLVLVGWVAMRKTTVLAASPTSVAARAALVAGGNLLELLPADAVRWTEGEVAAALGRETKFRLEWGAEEGGSLLEGEGGWRTIRNRG